MAITTTTLANWTRGELPEEYDALKTKLGEDTIQQKIDSVVTSLFGVVLDEAESSALDIRVKDYIGKLVALSLIGPAISYFSKQAIVVGSRGSNESKTYKDRAEDLKELRKELLEETRAMLGEVSVLLPNRRVKRTPVGPRVRQAVGVVTTDPDNWGPAYAPPTTALEGNSL